MRTTRVKKFRKLRRKAIIKLLIYFIILPASCLFAGYLISNVFIIPAMAR